MSSQPRTTNPTPDATATARTPFTTRDAPKTFSPHNTNPCPRMFADKWVATAE